MRTHRLPFRSASAACPASPSPHLASRLALLAAVGLSGCSGGGLLQDTVDLFVVDAPVSDGSGRPDQGIADLSAADLAAPDLRIVHPDLAAGAPCGGFGGATCPVGQFCDMPYHCGFADGGGSCGLLPDLCPGVIDPVCGCNGTQYNNECEAHRAGISVRSFGVCGCPGGGCEQGKYCANCFGKLACLPRGAIC